MRRFVLFTAILLLLAAEILRVYFIMPFPGSQRSETIGIAYWLGRNISWIRIVLLVLIIYGLMGFWKSSGRGAKGIIIVLLLLYGVVFYMFNFRFEADKMFYQPKHKSFAQPLASGADSVLVIGVEMGEEAKAYPIQIIGYHHQVVDTIGGTPAIITYCTVCRTGRVFSPLVQGKPETFRLVGMDHFNAMFEDATTKSWWRQATGECIAGPLKGQSLIEIRSRQSTLAAWMRLHPNTTVLQPDSSFKKQYDHLAGYNKGTIKGSLEKRDSASWQFKSWVVGVLHEDAARAYDWNELLAKGLLQDSLAGMPLVLALESDEQSFHAWSRRVKDQTLQFTRDTVNNTLVDSNTHSVWNMQGICVEGSLKDASLMPLPAYQEFWHSWQSFHPRTDRYH